MQATSRNERSRKSAEWTGLRATTTATAASQREHGEDDEEPAGGPGQKRAGHRAVYPRSTTVNGLTFGASRQSVSLRMSR